MTNMKKRQGYIQAGRALEIIIELAEKSQDIIRVITGYFTVKGYNTVRQHFKSKKLVLIVGIEDPGATNARIALVQEIMRELRTGLDDGREQAVRELISKIEGHQLQIFDARALDHHAKVYIFDDIAALVASSNFTFRGLHEREESGLPTTDPVEVNGFIKDFDEIYNRAIDITSDLIEALRQWLLLRTPWEIYLKTLLCLEGYERIPAVSKSYRFPVSYQRFLVTRSIKGIREHGGHFIVAQTGLGKTVVGTEVARILHNTREITHVMVIGPGPVEDEWKTHMLSAGIPCEYLIHQNLNFTDPSKSSPLNNFIDIVERYMNSKWLIIVDESHMFRNRYKEVFEDGQLTKIEKIAYQRLQSTRENTKAKILLLTGTPYSKDKNDINYQLALLPHTAQPPKRPGFEDMLKERAPRAWQVDTPNELRELDEVATVITTPVVVRNWARKDPDTGFRYIQYGDQNKYFPRIILNRIDIVVFLAEIILPIVESDILRLQGQLLRDPHTGEAINAHIIWSQRAGAIKAWASSPWALSERLKTTIDDNSEKEKGYKYSLDDRTHHLRPVIEAIDGLAFEDDHKLTSLLSLLDDLISAGRKVIIYCLYRPTISYLENALTMLRPSWKVFGTVYDAPKGYSSKPTNLVKQAIYRFAPEANQRDPNRLKSTIDVFISTDNFSVGVNMQDADAVINYDLPWDAVAPYQRAGRILRPWKDPRVIDIFIFVPKLPAQIDEAMEFKGLEKHWEKLVTRHNASSGILDLPVITTQDIHDIDMYQIGRVIELGEIEYETLSEIEVETSSILSRHMAQLEHNRESASEIPDDIVSAAYNQDKRIGSPYIFVLLKQDTQYYTVIYDLKNKMLRKYSEAHILDMIESTPQSETFLMPRDKIDVLGNECITAWCEQQNADPESIMRICTLYLEPQK